MTPVLADRITLDCWDVAEIVAMDNVANRMAMATNMLPNTEYHALVR